MQPDKPVRHNRLKEALSFVLEDEPPYFREYLRRYRDDPTSRTFAPLAEIYRRMGRLNEAIEICERGLAQHADFHSGRVIYAKCLIEKKMLSEARSELERVVASVPDNLLAQRLLGDTCLELNDHSQTLHHYKMALVLAPADVALAEKIHGLEKSFDTKSLDTNAKNTMREVGSDKALADQTANIPASTGRATDNTIPADKAGDGAILTDRVSDDGRPLVVDDRTPAKLPLPHEIASRTPPVPPPVQPQCTATTARDHSPVHSTANTKATVSAEPSSTSDTARMETTLTYGLLEFQSAQMEHDSFRVEHISHVFKDQALSSRREITTETLGDLYFSQGQYEQALKIFERLSENEPTPELLRKINTARVKMGVSQNSLIRQKKIEALHSLLKRVQTLSDTMLINIY